ncbi:hypothetical protein [Haloparvum sp. PAK95]|uniref:hypothetical protein n=1 Tax=Haloparvum sp. PAK95 TaxID=3418962 RepID=UPI003D2EA618
MTGPHPSKHELEGARVYVHEQDPESGAQVTHIDVEHPDINEIVESGENTYVGGKEGGVFIGLDDEMLDRAEAFLDARREEGQGEGEREERTE